MDHYTWDQLTELYAFGVQKVADPIGSLNFIDLGSYRVKYFPPSQYPGDFQVSDELSAYVANFQVSIPYTAVGSGYYRLEDLAGAALNGLMVVWEFPPTSGQAYSVFDYATMRYGPNALLPGQWTLPPYTPAPVGDPPPPGMPAGDDGPVVAAIAGIDPALIAVGGLLILYWLWKR